MPSTSGRAASHPRRVDKLKFFHELKQLRDRLKLEKGHVHTLDASYQQLQAIPSASVAVTTVSTATPGITSEPGMFLLVGLLIKYLYCCSTRNYW